MLHTMRRLCVGFACGNLLPEALKHVQIFMGVTQSMTTELAKLVAADAGNFSARTKLRLLRVCRGLCSGEAGWRAAVLVITLSAVDTLLFALLGDGETARATLQDLVSLDKSLVAASGQHLWALLAEWGAGSSKWELLEALGADMTDEKIKLWARAALLQLSAGLVDVFELRFSSPPYTAIHLGDDSVPLEERQAIAQELLEVLEHCKSLFLRRLLALCPTVPSLLHLGSHIARAWGQGSPLAIDYSERAHGAMRQDMRSFGRSRSATGCANRTVCQQVRSEVLARGGADLAKPQQAASGEQIGDLMVDDKQGRKRKVGTAFFEYLNHCMSVQKQLAAKGRRLTAEEMKTVQARAKEQ